MAGFWGVWWLVYGVFRPVSFPTAWVTGRTRPYRDPLKRDSGSYSITLIFGGLEPPEGQWISLDEHNSGIENKRTGNFTLDTSSYQSQHQPTSTTTQHTRVKQNALSLCKRTLIPARHVLEETSHQTRPKIDAGDVSLLMGIEN